jgi:hypothetical protein
MKLPPSYLTHTHSCFGSEVPMCAIHLSIGEFCVQALYPSGMQGDNAIPGSRE